MFTTCFSNNFVTIKSLKLVALVLAIALLINIYGHQYPENYDQPMKYRLISASAEFLGYFGHVLEYFNIGHRLILTRLGYHYSIGALNVRDSPDLIQIIDEDVEHLSMRIYRPLNQTMTMPTILFYHGGGHFVGSADILEPVTYDLAKSTNFQVIYTEFRLIPEHKFPAALSDSLLVTKHLLKNSMQYKIDMENVILMGDSAGGNLATVISQKLMSENICRPKLQVLVYPLLQFFDFTLPSYRLNLPKRILGNIHHENFINFLHYLTGLQVDSSVFANGHTTGKQKELFSEYVNVNLLPAKFRNHNLESINLSNDTEEKFTKLTEIILDKDLSPLLVSDEFLKQNTPANTLLITAEMDILRDDGFIYAERLNKQGLNIFHKHYENMFHGVLNLIRGPIALNQAQTLLNDISNAIQIIIKN